MELKGNSSNNTIVGDGKQVLYCDIVKCRDGHANVDTMDDD
jgi:hypothetical protein